MVAGANTSENSRPGYVCSLRAVLFQFPFHKWSVDTWLTLMSFNVLFSLISSPEYSCASVWWWLIFLCMAIFL